MKVDVNPLLLPPSRKSPKVVGIQYAQFLEQWSLIKLICLVWNEIKGWNAVLGI